MDGDWGGKVGVSTRATFDRLFIVVATNKNNLP